MPTICDFKLPPQFLLSVIVPIYNERETIEIVVQRLRNTGLPMQMVLIDDGSDDGSAASIDQLAAGADIEVIRHEKNLGKGAAIRHAVPLTRGDVVVIQDADCEYDPADFHALLQPILSGEADIVYGSRYVDRRRCDSPWWHRAANHFLTSLTSLSVGRRLSDVETCYKLASRQQFLAIHDQLQENRFGIEIELTARWARRGLRFTERPIRYQHRWYQAGKKIGFWDGVSALRCIFKYGLLKR